MKTKASNSSIFYRNSQGCKLKMRNAFIAIVIVASLLFVAAYTNAADAFRSLHQQNDVMGVSHDSDHVTQAGEVLVEPPGRCRNSVNTLAQEKPASDGFHLREKIQVLEQRIVDLEKQKKHFPEVKFLSYKDRKRILITGGAGFVGSHLVDRLMMEGHEVTVADNFFTGRKRNVEHWFGHENFELLNHDVVNPLYVEVDEIYHLASPASPKNYMYNPIKTIKTNTMGTINMLGMAKRLRAKLLMASTSEVYGDPEVHPQTEDYWGHVNPIGPRACYDEGKRVAETICYAYAKQDRVRVRVARIFNTFGPRMHMNDGRVVSNFIIQALQSDPITMYGDGMQTRSFQYVSDLVSGLIALMNSNYSLPVNIGNPDEHTIKDFAIIINQLVGNHSKIELRPAMQDDPKRRKPDITRAKIYLGWEPKVGMLDGINRTVEYFRNELKRRRHDERNVFLPEI